MRYDKTGEVRKAILDTMKEELTDEGELLPMIFYIKDQEIVGATSPPLALDKHVAMSLTGLLTKTIGFKFKKDFDSIVFAHSAWMVIAEGDKELERWFKEGKRVSEHPKKIEILLIVHSEGRGKHFSIAVPFYQTPDGPVFENPIESVGHRVESYLVDSFWKGYEAKHGCARS